MQNIDNLIAGEWLAGKSYSANGNTGNLVDVLGHIESTDKAPAASCPGERLVVFGHLGLSKFHRSVVLQASVVSDTGP